MPSKKFPYLVINSLLMLFIAGGCAAKIGDECASSAECPSGAICDVTVEDGYCTITPCEADSTCPSDSVCIKFSREESFCMAYCESSGDCRDGYTCRKDIEGPGFCYVPAEAPVE